VPRHRPLRFHGGGNSERRGHEELVLWEAAGPARVRSISEAMVWKCAPGQDPVDAPSAGPSGEAMNRSFLARRDGMGGAENVVRRRHRSRLRGHPTSPWALASPAAALIAWLGRAWLVIQT
jgi:hypothetical protein